MLLKFVGETSQDVKSRDLPPLQGDFRTTKNPPCLRSTGGNSQARRVFPIRIETRLFFGGFSRKAACRSNDGGDREVTIGDDRSCTLRQLDVRDMNAVANLQAGEVHRDEFRNVVGRNVQFNFVTNDVENATGLDAGGLLFVDEVNRNFDGNLAVLGNAQEVDVHGEVADRIQLIVLREDTDLFAVDVDRCNGGHETAGVDLAGDFLRGEGDGN